jgi:CheY-like chemotaxis protein
MAHVLVIDDEPMLRELLRRMLGGAGHDVREAASGDEGIRAAAAAPPDLVFCDMFMPGRDGFETMRELARVAPGTPVVAMSAGGFRGGLDVLPSASCLGATVTLAKPFTKSAVLQAVESVLASRGTG